LVVYGSGQIQTILVGSGSGQIPTFMVIFGSGIFITKPDPVLDYKVGSGPKWTRSATTIIMIRIPVIHADFVPVDVP